MAGGETAPDLRRSQAAALDEIVDTLMTLGDVQKAMTSARQAHDIFVALLKIDPNNTLWQRDLSVSDNKVGDVLLAQGDLKGALASYQDGLAIRKARVAKDPDNTEAQRDVSVSDNDVGNVLEAQGDLKGALAAYQEDNEICRKLAKTQPDNTEAQRDLSISDEKVGDVLKAQGDLTGALAVYREDHTICTKLAEDSPGNTQYQTDLAVSDERLADMLKLQNDFAGALEQYQAEVAIAERLLQIDSANMTLPRVVFYPTMRIGEIEVAQNNLTAALATFEKGERIALHLKKVNPTATLPGRDLAWAEDQLTTTLGAIASQKLAALDAAGVLAADQQRLAVARQIYAVIPTDTAKTTLAIALGSLSWAQVINKRGQDALNAAQEALGLDPTLLFLQTNRAHALLLLGRFNDAKAVYLDNKDKKFPNGKSFADVVRDDFATMRKFGIDTPDMKRIEAALTS
jgi:tetratricopeptide (TPR) repeat protein